MKKKLTLFILIAFILGIIGGLILPKVMISLSFLGTIYVNLLKMLIVPILFFGITTALNGSNRSSKVTIKTIILFIAMFVASFIINSLLVGIIRPGAGYRFDEIAWEGTLVSLKFQDLITSLIPSNLIAAAANNQLMPVIIFSFVVGIYLNKTGIPSFKIWFVGMNQMFNRILEWVMYLTPIGVFVLIGNTVATFGGQILFSAFKYIGVAWLGCLIIMILVMILPVWIYCKIKPWTYIKQISKIWFMTLSTCSSAATLPETIRVCNYELEIPEEITNIVVPLGCTIHMCGGAVSFSLLALFTMQMYSIPMTAPLFILMLVSALLINMGAPGIPGGGIVIGATYLNLLGLPLTFIGFYAGIYRVLDMAYTTMNVTGDITANCIIKESLE